MKPFHIYSDGTYQLSIMKVAVTSECQVMDCRRGPGISFTHYEMPVKPVDISSKLLYISPSHTILHTPISVPFQLPLRLRLSLGGCSLLGFLFQFVFSCLSAFIRSCFFEPIVLQGFFRCDTLIGVVYEYSFQKIKELLVEAIIGRNNILSHS